MWGVFLFCFVPPKPTTNNFSFNGFQLFLKTATLPDMAILCIVGQLQYICDSSLLSILFFFISLRLWLPNFKLHIKFPLLENKILENMTIKFRSWYTFYNNDEAGEKWEQKKIQFILVVYLSGSLQPQKKSILMINKKSICWI